MFWPPGAAARELRFMCYFGPVEFVCVYFVGEHILMYRHIHVWMHVPILLHNSVQVFMCAILAQEAEQVNYASLPLTVTPYLLSPCCVATLSHSG